MTDTYSHRQKVDALGRFEAKQGDGSESHPFDPDIAIAVAAIKKELNL